MSLTASGIYYPASTANVEIWDHFSDMADTIDPRPKGLIARGDRQSNSTATATEVGVLRVDTIAVKLGRAYKIWTSNLTFDSSSSGDVPAAKIRLSTSGAATTSSTVVGNSRDLRLVSTAEEIIAGGISTLYVPGADATVSVLLTISRFAGAGNVLINASATAPVSLVIEDIGATVADTGVDI